MNSQDAFLEEFEILDLLTSLVDRNLVVCDDLEDGTRFRCLETVRQYSRERLAAAGEAEQARTRHLEWYVDLAEEAAPGLTGPDQAAWLDRLEREYNNLRAALDWAVSSDVESTLGLRLGGSLQRFLHMRSYLTEGRQALEAVVARHGDGPPSAELGLALQGAGNMAYFVCDYDAARDLFQRSLEVRRQAGDRSGEAGALGSLGNVAQYTGDVAAARAYFEESLAINRETNHRVWEAMNLVCLGSLAHEMGDYDAAWEYYQEGLALNRAIGNRATEANCRNGMSLILGRRGDAEGARKCLRQALAISRELGDRSNECVYTANLGMYETRIGNLEEAASHFREAMMLARMGDENANRRVMVAILEMAAEMLVAIRQPEPASKLIGLADAHREALQAPRPVSDLDDWQRVVESVRDQMDAKAYASAVEDGAEMGIPDGVHLVLDALSASGFR